VREAERVCVGECARARESDSESARDNGRERVRAQHRERKRALEGQKQRALTHEPTGEKAEVLPIALEVTVPEVTAPDTAVHIQLHRRQGTHRVLSPVSLFCSLA